MEMVVFLTLFPDAGKQLDSSCARGLEPRRVALCLVAACIMGAVAEGVSMLCHDLEIHTGAQGRVRPSVPNPGLIDKGRYYEGRVAASMIVSFY